ncbi:hypothetical protein [Flammeovirga sp. EKP202]|uniref:hypothetical protein n=1 Tax=Flammeovirga sp. EKP202 TaxID=2770592 RepID=UPI00165FAC84|nr:hypothetical protein [Flammeovirga sp. EKP202]MBD0403478.1 hypothetical protein [Flammeovirga sp. EKP202]
MDLKSILPSTLKVFSDETLLDKKEFSLEDISFDDTQQFPLTVFNNAVNLELTTDAGLKINVYNDKDDFDEKGEKSLSLKNVGCGEDISSLLNSSSMIEYQLAANLKGKGSTSIKDIFTLKANTSASAKLSFLKWHGLNVTTKEAVSNDLANFKHILTNDYIQNLDVNEGVRFAFDAGVGLNFSVDVVELMSTILNPSTTLIDNNFLFKVNTDLKLSFEMKRLGDYETCLRVKPDGKVIVQISKLKEKVVEGKLAGKLSFSLTSDSKNAVEKLINEYYEGYLGDTFDNIDQYVNDDNIEKLKKLGERLFGTDDIEYLDEIKDKYEEIKKTVSDHKESISETLNETLVAEMSYAIRKLKSSQSLITFETDKATISNNLKQLLTFKIDHFQHSDLEDVVNVKEFLGIERENKLHQFNFSLRLGKWGVGRSRSTEIDVKETIYKGDKDLREIDFGVTKNFTQEKYHKDYSRSVIFDYDVITTEPQEVLKYSDLEHSITIKMKSTFGSKFKKAKKHLRWDFNSASIFELLKDEKYEKTLDEACTKINDFEGVTSELVLRFPDKLLRLIVPKISANYAKDNYWRLLGIAEEPFEDIPESYIANVRGAFYEAFFSRLNPYKKVELIFQTDTFSQYDSKWKLKMKNRFKPVGNNNKILKFLNWHRFRDDKLEKAISSLKTIFNADNQVVNGKKDNHFYDLFGKKGKTAFIHEMHGDDHEILGRLLLEFVKQNDLSSEIQKSFVIKKGDENIINL